MRKLTRNEVRKAAAVAGIKPDDPVLFDGRAEALLNAGIVIGGKMALNVLKGERHEGGDRTDAAEEPERAGVDVEVPRE